MFGVEQDARSVGQRMRIAFFRATVLEHGCGLERYFMEAAAGLQARCHDIDAAVVTLDERWYRRFVWLVSVYYLGLQRGRKREPAYRVTSATVRRRLGAVPYVQCRSLAALRRELRAYDLIYTSNEVLDLVALRLLGGKMPPTVAGVHTPPHYQYAPSRRARLHNRIFASLPYRRLLARCRALHVLNSDDQALYGGARAHLVPCPFPVGPAVPRAPHPSPEFHLLYAGRLMEQKGADLLPSLIGELGRLDLPGAVHIRVAGDGDAGLRRELERCAAQHQDVRYLGEVPQDEMAVLYEWSDVVLVPSRYETVSYVVLEAAAHGRAAIASDIAGLRDEIVQGETGFLVSLDVRGLSQQVAELQRLKHHDRRRFDGLGDKARQYVAEKYDADRSFTALHDLCRSQCRISRHAGEQTATRGEKR
jgi:glycosyltransferase involved in cell wall biosynthesis